MRITRIEKGSPAETTGKIKLKQIIESINGKAPNTEIDPRILLGNIITKAESTDGIIKLKVKAVGEVVVKIPVMGSYAKTWPLNCEKSNRIVTQLAELLIKQEKLSWGNTLFLLSTGETKYLPIVKKQLDAKEKIGGIPWHYGMLGIAFCEYYLRTGDKSVLPKIDLALEGLKKMMFNGGWSGRGYGSSFTYSTGSGQLNAAGVHCVTFIMLAKMCGAKVDDEMLQRSLTNFYRNAGHGNLAYGDGWPEGGFRDNGKSSAFAIAMAAAARLTPNGETTVYAKARDNMAMKSFYATNWFHSAHTGGGIGEIWHHGAMSLMKEKRPLPYRSYMDSRTWVMDLSRRHDGSVGIAGVDDRYDQSASEHERDWGTYFALMTYTAPRKALIIFGAPKTKFCKSYPLPERPWGRPADDLFVSPDPIPGGPLSRGDLLKESVEKDSSLPVFKKMGKNLLEEYLYHPEYGLRISTISRISESSNPKKLVLKLLKEDDPRLRHLGASTISGVFKNKPLSDDQLTPEMFKLLGEMIENPEEALWVVQEAMRALSRAKIEVIAQHKKTLLGYLSHESWFLQTTAIEALSPLMAHKSYYKEVMPPVMTTFAKLRSNQAFTPVWQMQSKITSAPKEIKDFAMKEVKRAYKLIPNQLVDSYSGRLIPNGTSAIRKKISYLTDNLPENQAFKLSIPKMTAMAILSGKSEDFYHYEGFKPNPKILGTWLAPPKGNTWANDKKTCPGEYCLDRTSPQNQFTDGDPVEKLVKKS